MKKILGLAFAVALSSGAAQSATVLNGGFDANPLGPSTPFATLPGPGGLDNWTIGGAGVDLIHTLYSSADGDGYSLDLSATSAGSVAQTITGLTMGSVYKVTFAMAAYLSGVPAFDTVTKSLTVSVGGPAATYSATSTAVPNLTWTNFDFLFTATAASQVLTFTSLANNPVGPALDAVSISEVPVPAGGLLLLSGLGGIFAMRRRRG